MKRNRSTSRKKNKKGKATLKSKSKRKNKTRRKHQPRKKNKAAAVKPDIPGPLWKRTPGNGPLHPQLDAVLKRPFVSTICIDGNIRGFKYPLDANDMSRGFALMKGLKKQMARRFWREHPEVKRKRPKKGWKLWPSDNELGSRADREIENAIAYETVPVFPYAVAVLDYWRERGHRPVLAQLPVIMMNRSKTSTRVCTAGDYFTLWLNPENGEEELWLWELKTGWPHVPRKPHIMSHPLAYVDLTPFNKWHLQLLYTKLAYEKEMGMKIDQSRVIHCWKKTVKQGDTTDVEVDTFKWVTKELPPPDWVQELDEDEIYYAL